MKIVPMSVELLDWMGSDLSVVNAARVSFNRVSDWRAAAPDELASGDYVWDVERNYGVKLSDRDVKLITYLATHGHWTPFAHNSLSFRIKAPIFVARQFVKHQVGGVWNEVSRRYVDDEPEFWFPEVWRGKPINAKQGSDGIVEDVCNVKHPLELCLRTYNDLLQSGDAPEQARMVLPQNTMTEWIWTGSLAFFARVCKQRLDAHAQQETREVAQQLANLVPTEFQHSWRALIG